MKLYIFTIVFFTTLTFYIKSQELIINLNTKPLSDLVRVMDLISKRPEVTQMEETVGTQFTTLLQLLMNYAGFCYTIQNKKWQKLIDDINKTCPNNKDAIKSHLNKLEAIRINFLNITHEVKFSLETLCSHFGQRFHRPQF